MTQTPQFLNPQLVIYFFLQKQGLSVLKTCRRQDAKSSQQFNCTILRKHKKICSKWTIFVINLTFWTFSLDKMNVLIQFLQNFLRHLLLQAQNTNTQYVGPKSCQNTLLKNLVNVYLTRLNLTSSDITCPDLTYHFFTCNHLICPAPGPQGQPFKHLVSFAQNAPK